MPGMRAAALVSTRVCSHITRDGKSCPNLAPCPEHTRPRNQPWSKDRNTTTQGRERKATLQRDGYTCQRCGHHDPTGRNLDAHHATPTRLITLCNACHVEVDPNARRR
jgi:5-methylcytosine-specific restriction endonuclease McrA